MKKICLLITLFAYNAYGMESNFFNKSEYPMEKSVQYDFSMTITDKNPEQLNTQSIRMRGFLERSFSNNDNPFSKNDNPEVEQRIDQFINFLQVLKAYYQKK